MPVWQLPLQQMVIPTLGEHPEQVRTPKATPSSSPGSSSLHEDGIQRGRPGASRHTRAVRDKEPTVCASQGRIPPSNEARDGKGVAWKRQKLYPLLTRWSPSKTFFVLRGNNPGSTRRGTVPAPRRCSALGIPGMALTQPYKSSCSCSSCLTGSTGSIPYCNPGKCDAPQQLQMLQVGGKACGKCAISRRLCPGTHFPLLPIFLPCSAENLLLYCEFSAPLGSLVSFTHNSRREGEQNQLFQATAVSPSPLECFYHVNTVRAKRKQKKKYI